MIDMERLEQVKAMMDVLPGTPAFEDDPLLSMSETDLRKLRADIDRLLPGDNLASIDVEAELVGQYLLVKGLQDLVLNDESIPLNQRSQLAGQVASTLQQLVKMQVDFYTPGRFRKIEELLMKFMKALPLEQASKFVDEYEAIGSDDV